MDQCEELNEVIHSDGDDGRAERGGGEGDEAALPLESQHGKQGAGAQQDTQGHPYRFGVVELLHSLMRIKDFLQWRENTRNDLNHLQEFS